MHSLYLNNTMKLVQQKNELRWDGCNIENNVSELHRKNGPLLPNTIRALVAGCSGAGKTTAVVELLKHKNGVRFKNLVIFGRTSSQPKYENLIAIIKDIPGMGVHRATDIDVGVEQIPAYTAVIFDDLVTQKQGEIQKFFAMGRHKQIDLFYLSQTYAFIKKQLIRDNANIIVLFRMDRLNLKHAFNDHVVGDMPFDMFIKLCHICWNEPKGFLVIDKTCGMNSGRYRCGFDKFFKNTS